MAATGVRRVEDRNVGNDGRAGAVIASRRLTKANANENTEAMTMTRKIAVVVRDRESEALRMALGLTLMDDIINVFMLDRTFDLSEADAANKELMEEMDIAFFSNEEGNADMQYVATEELARLLTEYDHVIPY